MRAILRTPAEATPERLTSLLRRQGVLPQGEVEAVTIRRNAAFNSLLTHLELTYSENAPDTVPRALALKANLPQEWAKATGKVETAFYESIGRLPDHPPMTVPCYEAQYDPITGDSHLLLRDLSKTHHIPLTRDQQLKPGENLPEEDEAEAVIETLAEFHAYWWEHPLLGSETFPATYWFRDADGFARYIQHRRMAYQDLIAAESAWFPAELVQLYESTLAALPQLWARFWQPRVAGLRQMTLTHGEAYFANFLCPNDKAAGGVYRWIGSRRKRCGRRPIWRICWRGFSLPSSGRKRDGKNGCCLVITASYSRQE